MRTGASIPAFFGSFDRELGGSLPTGGAGFFDWEPDTDGSGNFPVTTGKPIPALVETLDEELGGVLPAGGADFFDWEGGPRDTDGSCEWEMEQRCSEFIETHDQENRWRRVTYIVLGRFRGRGLASLGLLLILRLLRLGGSRDRHRWCLELTKESWIV